MDTEKIKEEVWKTVQDINRAWAVQGDVSKLAVYFHKDMVVISPLDGIQGEGGEACVDSYRTFIEAAKIYHLEESDPNILLYNDGELAIVTYHFDIAYDMAGKSCHEIGQEMLVMTRQDGKWQVVTKVLLSYADKK